MEHIAGHICTVILWQKQVVTCATNALERRPSGAHLYVQVQWYFMSKTRCLRVLQMCWALEQRHYGAHLYERVMVFQA